MSILEATEKDKTSFNRLALHPMQSWQWGQFRIKTGIEVVRLGRYIKEKIVETAQLTIHRLPFTSRTIGYLPKGGIPSNEMLQKLFEVGKRYNCIFIKLEPNIAKESSPFNISNFTFEIVHSPHPLFTQYTFQLDLTKSEEELLKNMHPKTRYNIRTAQKHQVKVQEDNSPEAFRRYLRLMDETTKRQKYFAHTKIYHERMWETLRETNTAHLLTATYLHEGKTYTLVSWILFLFNGCLYYPYGASGNLFRNTMASNLMMWEAKRFGKKKGAKLFDMWGSLGPDPDPKDPWYGFHRFKQGYGAHLVEFIGSFDLVINPSIYTFYNLLHAMREELLKLKAFLHI